MNANLQFRVLYRQFLFRLMDVEMLSASARGDASGLFGQFGALLIFGSVVLSFGAITVGQAIRRGGTAPGVWSAERFLVSLTMLVVGLFVVLSWDSTFLDRRDVLVLAPLPVRGRTLFGAKIAASASALGLIVVALHCLSAFVWPMVLAPAGSGVVGTIRLVAAFWVTFVAVAAFLYCAVLGVQGVAAQLTRRWYLRVSPILQIAAFILFLGVFCLQPSLDTPKALSALENQRTLAWLPTYWFLGLLSELSGAFAAEGHAVMAPLAYRALAGLAAAILAGGSAFLISYLRTLRKIVEEPDIVPGSRGGNWLPRFGNAQQTALSQFVIRTLLRSREHRVILAFYLGGGFAIVALYLGIMSEVAHLTGVDILHRVNVPLLAASVLMLCASWLGTRTVFSLPLDLRANWLFRVTPAPGGASRLSAVRRALLALSVIPVSAGCAVLLLWFWPWTPSLEHLLVLGLFGSILADLSLSGFRKIPFTCSYLPGKSMVHMVFWFGIIPLVFIVHKLVDLEQRAMASPLSYCAMIATLAAAAFAARWLTNTSADCSEPEIQFEESSPDELIVLDL
ncbi:membrane hypothetical protein [Candidatus Sulfopaludibacter sp. SbA3]|nr:membrane hypothetical protein [Candidatus Sulfopaludibacter sp. SbA3]